MMKTCSKCHLPKNDNDFSPNKSACKVCRNTEQKLYAQNNKETVRAGENNKKIRNRNYIYNSKLNKACIDCGITYDPCILQYDHINNNKVNKISNMITNSSIERIQKEINKCELVCTNCHRNRTHSRTELNKIVKKSKTPIRDKFYLIINEIKELNPCMDCHKYYHSWQMDFDHRDQNTKINSITRIIIEQYSIEQIMEEIKKCDLVCANCHAFRSSKQLNYNKHIMAV